jgi:hypothetical protein
MNVKPKIKTANKVRHTKRIERVLALIVFMNESKTVLQCSNEIGVHYMTVFNYFNLLIELGLDIELSHKGKFNKYRISNLNEFFRLK